MDIIKFLLYLIVMASVTYLVRMLPLVFFTKKIKNRFIRSFLYYVPYSVLSVMTIPAIFTSCGYLASAVLGSIAAVILAYFRKSLVVVASGAAAVVLVSELVIPYII